MKAALSLTLVVCLAGTTLPVTAQERINRTAGPISRVISFEAIRLAAEPAAVDAGHQAGTWPNAGWSRVLQLQPGTEITVTIRGSEPVKRDFVSADDSGVRVLNVSGPALPADVKRVLVETASTHPEYFDELGRGRTFVTGNNEVRVAPDGVFLNGHKTAEVRQLVETHARNKVIGVEGRASRRDAAVLTALTAVGGAFAGSIIGSQVYRCCGDDPGLEGAVIGFPVGAIAGAVLGYYAFSRKTQDVIYRAP